MIAKEQVSMNLAELRSQFPTLSRDINGKPLVYFDNGATAQKPQSVIDTISNYYEKFNANIHRGVHTLSQEATQLYEDARVAIQQYLNANSSDEIIFTKGTTDGINLVANGFRKSILKPGDQVLISAMEHHSNIVPWQMVCEETGAELVVIPILDSGELDMEAFERLLSDRVKLLSITHVSNTMGTIVPVEDLISKAHDKGIPVLIDGAQSMQHFRVDVQSLDADFYVFSGHKMFGPTGVGVLYGKEEWLNQLPPYQGGGDMIKTVTFEKTTYNDLPHKFEAGTPNIAGGIGLKAAVEFMNQLDFNWVHEHEQKLLTALTEVVGSIDGMRIIGTAKNKGATVSFVHEKAHHYDIGTLIDQMGIAIRTGHHCTEPLMHRMGVTGTARASLAFYNTEEEIEKFGASLKRALRMLL
jgi:cysteine desulfurase/selenocysteine lyase